MNFSWTQASNQASQTGPQNLAIGSMFLSVLPCLTLQSQMSFSHSYSTWMLLHPSVFNSLLLYVPDMFLSPQRMCCSHVLIRPGGFFSWVIINSSSFTCFQVSSMFHCFPMTINCPSISSPYSELLSESLSFQSTQSNRVFKLNVLLTLFSFSDFAVNMKCYFFVLMFKVICD